MLLPPTPHTRTHTHTHSSVRRKRITNTRSFLVDNPIYKSNSSLLGSEATPHTTTTLSLRAVGSEPSTQASPEHNTKQHTAAATADNPQYGTHSQYPPPQGKPPRYVKVGAEHEQEPTYQMIEGASGKGAQEPNGNTLLPSAPPIYSMPSPVSRTQGEGQGQGQGLVPPIYDSAIDIFPLSGKDGDYSKLNHNA